MSILQLNADELRQKQARDDTILILGSIILTDDRRG